MTLTDLASLGSFVSGVAVAVTLVMLLLQMRQTARNQRAAMQLGRATRGTDYYMRLVDPEVARISRKAMASTEPLSGDELFVWLFLTNAGFFNWEDTFLQYRAGLLDKASMESEETLIRGNMSMPAWRAMWEFSRGRLGHEFAQYVDEIIAETPLIKPADIDALYHDIYRDLMNNAVSVSPSSPSQMIADYQSLFGKKQ